MRGAGRFRFDSAPIDPIPVSNKAASADTASRWKAASFLSFMSFVQPGVCIKENLLFFGNCNTPAQISRMNPWSLEMSLMNVKLSNCLMLSVDTFQAMRGSCVSGWMV